MKHVEAWQWAILVARETYLSARGVPHVSSTLPAGVSRDEAIADCTDILTGDGGPMSVRADFRVATYLTIGVLATIASYQDLLDSDAEEALLLKNAVREKTRLRRDSVKRLYDAVGIRVDEFARAVRSACPDLFDSDLREPREFILTAQAPLFLRGEQK